jgi:anaerobic selenocysteine-containing dehydrogenase
MIQALWKCPARRTGGTCSTIQTGPPFGAGCGSDFGGRIAADTPEMVERVTGCPKDLFFEIAETLARNSGRERTGAICYAVGGNHHSVGVQMIRAAAIVQWLLGNIGRPGGGIIALRGHCSIQGSTNISTLYNMLPSYLPQPNAFKPQARHFDQFLDDETIPTICLKRPGLLEALNL